MRYSSHTVHTSPAEGPEATQGSCKQVIEVCILGGGAQHCTAGPYGNLPNRSDGLLGAATCVGCG